MIYEIMWSSDAVKSFNDRIYYLEQKWTEKEIIKFKRRVSIYLHVLENTPYIGKSAKLKGFHIGLILKPVSLIYRVKPLKKEVELVLFIDNRQNPAKTKKYK